MRHSEETPVRATVTPPIAATAQSRARTSTLAERRQRQEELLDAALLETFPASDPISVTRLI